jgi:hypothetical protein
MPEEAEQSPSNARAADGIGVDGAIGIEAEAREPAGEIRHRQAVSLCPAAMSGHNPCAGNHGAAGLVNLHLNLSGCCMRSYYKWTYCNVKSKCNFQSG